MNFSFAHDFDIDAQAFWDMFLSEPFEAELFKRLKMRSYTVLERKDEGNVVRRSIKLDPEMNVPSWASGVIKDTGYTEHDVYYKDRSSMDVRVEPTMMKDRFSLSAVFKVTPLGPGRCRREFTGEAKVSVPLLGGKIEKMLVEQMKTGYDQAAEVTRDWIARNKK